MLMSVLLIVMAVGFIVIVIAAVSLASVFAHVRINR